MATKADRYKHDINEKGQETKQCGKCKQFKLLELFSNSKGSWDGKIGRCKSCVAIVDRERIDADIFRQWTQNTVSGHRTKGYTVLFSAKELENSIKENGSKCYICGKELQWINRRGSPGTDDNTPTLDRVHNESIMTLENTKLCCMECNRVKGSKSIEALDLYMIKLLERRGYKVIRNV